MADDMTVNVGDVRRAQQRIASEIELTPVEHSKTLSALTGAQVHLKFENHQFTASFKERGALNRMLDLTPNGRGNWYASLAYGAKRSR